MSKLKWIIFILIVSIIYFSISGVISSKSTEPWVNQGLEWYYDNLDDNDRRKIRQAMDYVIPREQITNNLWGGLAVPLATEIGQNTQG